MSLSDLVASGGQECLKNYFSNTDYSLILIPLNHIYLVLLIATKLYLILNSFLLVKVPNPSATLPYDTQ